MTYRDIHDRYREIESNRRFAEAWVKWLSMHTIIPDSLRGQPVDFYTCRATGQRLVTPKDMDKDHP